MQLVALAQVAELLVAVEHRRLAQQQVDAGIVAVHHLTQEPQALMGARSVIEDARGQTSQVLGCVGKFGSLADAVHDIGPEPVDPTVHPEPQDIGTSPPALVGCCQSRSGCSGRNRCR